MPKFKIPEKVRKAIEEDILAIDKEAEKKDAPKEEVKPSHIVDCSECAGTGLKDGALCDNCKGSGKVLG